MPDSNSQPPRRLTGHAPFERVPLAVHERLEGAAADGGGLLGQFFSPLTGKAHKTHGHTITLGGCGWFTQFKASTDLPS